jgi:hypothetical protein
MSQSFTQTEISLSSKASYIKRVAFKTGLRLVPVNLVAWTMQLIDSEPSKPVPWHTQHNRGKYNIKDIIIVRDDRIMIRLSCMSKSSSCFSLYLNPRSSSILTASEWSISLVRHLTVCFHLLSFSNAFSLMQIILLPRMRWSINSLLLLLCSRSIQKEHRQHSFSLFWIRNSPLLKVNYHFP